jgi:hypothetical protein
MTPEQLELTERSFSTCRAAMHTSDGRDMLLKTYSMVLNLDTRLEMLGYSTVDWLFSTAIPSCVQFTVQLEDWKMMYMITPAKWMMKSDDDIRAYFTEALKSLKEQ